MSELVKIEKKSLTLQIERELLEKIKAEAKRRGVTVRAIVEHCMREFLCGS